MRNYVSGMNRHLVHGILGAILVWPLSVHAQWPESGPGDPYRPFFDQSLEPGYQAGLVFIEESQFKGHGESSVIEIDAHWAFVYLSDFLGGEIDGNLLFDAKIFSGSAALELPDQLASLAVDMGWTWHSVNDFAVQTRFAPGLYSDIEEIGSDAIFWPFSLALARGFTPGFYGVLGLNIRPYFKHVVMPIVGVDWEITNLVHLKAQLPESRLIYYATANWTAYAGLKWESTTYALRDKASFDREQITLEDFRYFGGLRYRINDELRIALEIGEVFDRDVEFGRASEDHPSDVDIDDAFFFRFAILGPF